MVLNVETNEQRIEGKIEGERDLKCEISEVYTHYFLVLSTRWS